MQIENDYDKEIHNDDLGVVSRIDVEEGEVTLNFDGRDDSAAALGSAAC